MEFKDWRTSSSKPTEEQETAKGRRRGRQFNDYVEELIHEAQERGDFSNLPGAGKPLKFLEDETYAGDKAMAYSILKNNGFAPAEIELAKEIQTELERLEATTEKLQHQGQALRSRRVPPFASEKRAYNAAVEQAATLYEQKLRELNRKILTLNITTPPAMHKQPIQVEQRMQEFREACPLLI